VLAAKVPAIRLNKDQWTAQLGHDVWDDEFRVLLEAQLWALTQELLASGQSVILEWGHWARVERDEKRLGARALGVGVELHYLEASLDELIERAERRTASGEWRAAPMTRAHFEEWATIFQPPDEDELLLFDSPSHPIRIRRVEPGDGLRLKSVRLAALEDSPDAFASTHAAEVARRDEEWAQRAQAGSTGASRITLFAEGAQGVVGLIGGYRATDSRSTVELVSMWVTPSARRAGVGRALVEAVVDWARETEASEVALGVVQGNAAAQRLYDEMGFTTTGTATPLASNPSLVEVRMAKRVC